MGSGCQAKGGVVAVRGELSLLSGLICEYWVIHLVWEMLHVHLSGKSQGIKETFPL